MGLERCDSCLQMLDAGEAVNWKQQKIDFSGTPDYIIRTQCGVKQTYLSVNISKTTTTKTLWFLKNESGMSANCCVWSQSPPQRRFPWPPPPLLLHYIRPSLSNSVPSICLFPSSNLSELINIVSTADSLVWFLSTCLGKSFMRAEILCLIHPCFPSA